MLFLTVSFDIWNDNQHCRYTHALSKSKTLLPRHTLPKTQILFHTHTSAVFGQCCQWTLLKDSRPVPPPALPVPVSSHSLAHFFCPVKHHRSILGEAGWGDCCWQDVNTICSSSIRRSKAPPHSAEQNWTCRTNLISCRSHVRCESPLLVCPNHQLSLPV